MQVTVTVHTDPASTSTRHSGPMRLLLSDRAVASPARRTAAYTIGIAADWPRRYATNCSSPPEVIGLLRTDGSIDSHGDAAPIAAAIAIQRCAGHGARSSRTGPAAPTIS